MYGGRERRVVPNYRIKLETKTKNIHCTRLLTAIQKVTVFSKFF